jgi:hypothetical protein
MAHDSNRSSKLAVAVLALLLSPSAAWAQAGGDKATGAPGAQPAKPPAKAAPVQAAPKATGAKPAPAGGHDHGHGHAHGHDHGHGHAHGNAGEAPGQAKAAPKPAAPALQGAELAKAADSMSSSCGALGELRERIEALANQRKAAQAAIRTAENESRKQLRGVDAARKKLELALKKPGADTGALLESARAAHTAAVAQNDKIASESQSLRASEDELTSLASAADQLSDACAKGEAALRAAAAEARKVVAFAQREVARARALSRLPAAPAREAARAKQARDLEALRKSSDEAKGALEALKYAAPAAAEAKATPAAK